MEERIILELIKELAAQNSNDAELGKKVRIVLNKIKNEN